MKNVTETYNYNESVFLHLTVRDPGIELVNSLGRHISQDFICFDSQYEVYELHMFLTEKIQDAVKI